MPASSNSAVHTHLFVSLGGETAPPGFGRDLLEISVESNLHLPDVATVRLYDPDLRWVDEAKLAPGQSLEVSAGQGGDPPVLFDGEIVEIEPHFEAGTQQLVVRAFDRGHRLARGRHVRSFEHVSDGDLVEQLAQEVELQAHVEGGGPVHPYILQNNETNLDFLRARAAALGNVLFVRGRTLHCEPLQSTGTPISLERGVTLHEFLPRLTTIGQVERVTVRGWDPDAKQDLLGEADSGHGMPRIGESKTGGDLARDAFNLPAQGLVTDRPLRTQAEAERLAQAELDRVVGRFIEAEGWCTGNSSLIAGSEIQVDKVGRRFGGKYVVTSATHVYNPHQPYTTHFNVSAYDCPTLLNLLCPAPQRPLMGGLLVGVVTDNQDPNGDGRVKVRFPSLSEAESSDWARVVIVGGGAQRGIEFLPEVDDEVLVGFELGDVNFPYVLGGLWNGHDAPPTRSDQLISNGLVQRRLIRSRSGHSITLDDGDAGSISIVDRNGNRIVLDSQSNALSIEVDGDASIKATGNLTLEAQGHVELKGMGIKVDGQAANVEITGMLVKLN